MNEVIVVGSCMIDLNAYCSKLPQPNETVFGSKFIQSFGGKGANQAVQSSKLGVETILIGCIGNDSFGTLYIEQLEKEKVNFQGKRSTNDTSTGIAHITIADNGKNFITIIPAANNELDEEYIIYKKDLIINSKVLLTQNEIKKETTKTALKIAKENNVLTIFNPAPAEPFESLIEILQLADIICPNEIELSILTSLPTNTNEEIEIASKKLKDKTNCNKIITTLGDRGCCVIEEDNVIFINTESVNAIDTVGAGDSFIGTLGANIARKENLFNSIIKALHCASLSVQKNGAQVSYVTCNELTQEFLPPPPI